MRVTCRRLIEIEIIVDDDGPGIPYHALEKIFERFYTDRPDQGFGQNSGLGLPRFPSRLSKPTAASSAGENRSVSLGGGLVRNLGARFVVRLPAK